MLLQLAGVLMCVLPAQHAQVPPPERILATLRHDHPRLIVLDEDVARVKALLQTNDQARKLYAQIKAEADRTLREKPIVYRLVGPRLLAQSRRCLMRVYTLGTVYRLEGGRQYADRAIKEMLTAAAFKDWNPRHFLDTAEMAHALAIGYDWFYDVMTPQEKETIRRAIIEKGLLEGKKVYEKGAWWSRTRYNWNQVCNGGMTIGALAIADTDPELAAQIIHWACNSVQIAMSEYAPDGGWAEGPGYWNYATIYNTYMLAALESALGTDFGLHKAPGFSVTGRFRIHTIGPTGKAFNFADGHERVGSAPEMFWLARKFNNPVFAWHEREVVRGDHPLNLWWFDPRGDGPGDEPLARHFRHVDVVTMRTSWADPNAIYVGFKGGDNRVNHSHLELGSFVLDALGERWALDLGSDNYNLPGYFGGKRWTYYRLGTAGQNTLWVDRGNQDPRAVAPIVAFKAKAGEVVATADLSAAYYSRLGKVLRRVRLVGHEYVEVEDQIEKPSAAEIVWQMHTRADVSIQESRALLKQNGKELWVEIVSPADVKFDLWEADPPPPQAQQPDVHKLVIVLDKYPKPVRLLVRFRPVAN